MGCQVEIHAKPPLLLWWRMQNEEGLFEKAKHNECKFPTAVAVRRGIPQGFIASRWYECGLVAGPMYVTPRKARIFVAWTLISGYMQMLAKMGIMEFWMHLSQTEGPWASAVRRAKFVEPHQDQWFKVKSPRSMLNARQR